MIRQHITYNSKRRFSVLLAFLTILNGYTFFFAGSFSLGMIFASFYSILSLIRLFFGGDLKKMILSPIFVLFGFVIITLIAILTLPSSQVAYFDITYDLLKTVVWAVMISISGYFYFDYKIFSKTMISIAVISTIFLLFQFFAISILGFSIPNAINLGVIRPTYTDYIYSIGGETSQIRLSSFWLEPSQYGNYMIGALIILLFDKTNSKVKNKFYTLLILVGIVLSTSSGAIYMMIFVLFAFLISYKGRYPIIRFTLVLSAFLAIPLIIIIYNSNLIFFLKDYSTFSYSLYRAITKIELWRTSARIGSSLDVINLISRMPINKFVGLGVGNEIRFLSLIGREFTYLNSIAKTITWVGFIGMGIYLIFVFDLMIKSKKSNLSIMMILFCLLGGLYSGLWYSPDSIVFYTIALYSVTYKTPKLIL